MSGFVGTPTPLHRLVYLFCSSAVCVSTRIAALRYYTTTTSLTPQSQKDDIHVLHNHCKLNLTPQSQKDAILHSHCTVARNTVKIQ